MIEKEMTLMGLAAPAAEVPAFVFVMIERLVSVS